MNKRGAMELSFGMIFAIILIAVFIVFAFFGIKKFLIIQEQVKYRQFTEDLQYDIDKIWKSAQSSKKVEYGLPSKITEVCFENKDYKNIRFEPREEGFDSQTINNLDLTSMFAESEDPICIRNKEGMISMTLSKDYSQNLVTISR